MALDQIVATTTLVGVDTSDSKASTVECFRNPKNHLRGCVSILNVSRERAKWNPARSTEAITEQYLREIPRFPGFKLEDSGRFSYQIEPAEWSTYLPILVTSLVPENVSSHRPAVLGCLQELEGLIRSREQDFRSPLLFVQLLRKDQGSDAVSFAFYSAKLTLSPDPQGTIHVTNTEASSSHSIFRVDGRYMSSDAERLAGWMPAMSVEQWQQLNTTVGKGK